MEKATQCLPGQTWLPQPTFLEGVPYAQLHKVGDSRPGLTKEAAATRQQNRGADFCQWNPGEGGFTHTLPGPNQPLFCCYS